MRDIDFKVTARPDGSVIVCGTDKSTGIMHGQAAPNEPAGRAAVEGWFRSDEFPRFAAAGGFKV